MSSWSGLEEIGTPRILTVVFAPFLANEFGVLVNGKMRLGDELVLWSRWSSQEPGKSPKQGRSRVDPSPFAPRPDIGIWPIRTECCASDRIELTIPVAACGAE